MTRKHVLTSLIVLTAMLPRPAAASLKWTEGAPPPRAKAGQAVGWCGDEIVCAGGTWWEGEKKLYTDEVHAYNPKTDRWRELPRYPVPIAYSVTATYKRDLYVIGGWTGAEAVLDCYRLRAQSPDQRSGASLAPRDWEKFSELPGPRVFSAGAIVGPTVYVIAGCKDFKMTDGGFTDAIRLDLGRPEKGWQTCALLPGPSRSTLFAVGCGGKVYLFGGYHNHPTAPFALADVYCYEPGRDRWRRVADMPGAVYAGPVDTLDGRHIYLFGGVDTERGFLNAKGDVEFPFTDKVIVYDTATDTYSSSTPMPHPCAADAAPNDGKRFYVLGGEVGFHVRSPWTMIAGP